jgi:hypothetical protein
MQDDNFIKHEFLKLVFGVAFESSPTKNYEIYLMESIAVQFEWARKESHACNLFFINVIVHQYSVVLLKPRSIHFHPHDPGKSKSNNAPLKQIVKVTIILTIISYLIQNFQLDARC